MEKNPKKKFVLLGETHEFLDECKRRLSFKKVENYTEWVGMRQKCPLREGHDTVKRLIESSTPVRYICAVCSRKEWLKDECSYKSQFKDPSNIVLAPREYLATQYIQDFKPDWIFADDVTMKINGLPTYRQVEAFSPILNDYEMEDIKNAEINEMTELSEKIDRELRSQLGEFVDLDWLDDYIYTGKWEFLIDPFELADWHRLGKIYGDFKKRFGIPYLHYLLNLASEGYNVVISEAMTPSRKSFLKDLIKLWEVERSYEHLKETLQNPQLLWTDEVEVNPKFKVDLKFEDLTPDEIKNSTIHRVVTSHSWNAWYPRQTLENERTRERIVKRIETILENYEEDARVGVITFKDYEEFFKKELNNNRALHFGDLLGKNLLRDSDVLFVIGTQTIGHDIIDQRELYFRGEPLSTEAKEMDEGGYRWADDQKLELLRKNMEDYEQFQAIHRGRPAQKEMDVYVFGRIPEAIKEKFETKNIIVEGGQIQRAPTELDLFIEEVMREESKYGSMSLKQLSKRIDEEYPTLNRRKTIYNLIRSFAERNKDRYTVEKKKQERGRPYQVLRYDKY